MRQPAAMVTWAVALLIGNSVWAQQLRVGDTEPEPPEHHKTSKPVSLTLTAGGTYSEGNVNGVSATGTANFSAVVEDRHHFFLSQLRNNGYKPAVETHAVAIGVNDYKARTASVVVKQVQDMQTLRDCFWVIEADAKAARRMAPPTSKGLCLPPNSSRGRGPD
jgi:hypothetical protein